MKMFNELTKSGKKKRINKALSIFDCNCSVVLNKTYEQLNKYDDNDNDETYLDKARDELLKANKYRGYTNYCPIQEVEELLG